jgi:hypothetical protein
MTVFVVDLAVQRGEAVETFHRVVPRNERVRRGQQVEVTARFYASGAPEELVIINLMVTPAAPREKGAYPTL